MSEPEAVSVAASAGQQHMDVMRFVGEDGRTLDFTPHGGVRFDVRPLDFTQFVKAAESKAPSFPVVITNASAPAASTGLEIDGPLEIKAVMEGNGPVLAYGLVDGGWLPMPWAHKRLALLDRNVIIKLEEIQQRRVTTECEHVRESLVKWLGLDSDTLSPMLFGLEGKDQRLPTAFETRVELSRAVKALARILPGAKIQVPGTAQRKALHSIVVKHAAFRARATRLLIRAVPLVAHRVTPGKRLKLEQDLLQLARDEGVRADCLAMLALLSCVYDANPSISSHRSATPGRAVLKPKLEFSEKDAYNALADMFALELLHNGHAIFPTVKTVLYTQDVGMASLWVATQPCTRQTTQGRNGNVRTTVSFGLDCGLFPALSGDEVVALKARLGV